MAPGDCELALCGLSGDAPLSATLLALVKARRQLEYDAWKQRRLEELEVVYVWANRLAVKAELEDSKASLVGAGRARQYRLQSH